MSCFTFAQQLMDKGLLLHTSPLTSIYAWILLTAVQVVYLQVADLKTWMEMRKILFSR